MEDREKREVMETGVHERKKMGKNRKSTTMDMEKEEQIGKVTGK